jgi:hypothetical protein
LSVLSAILSPFVSFIVPLSPSLQIVLLENNSENVSRSTWYVIRPFSVRSTCRHEAITACFSCPPYLKSSKIIPLL